MEGAMPIQCADVVVNVVSTELILLTGWECQFHVTEQHYAQTAALLGRNHKTLMMKGVNEES